MNPFESAISELPSASVVSFGELAGQVATAVADHYPITHHAVAGDLVAVVSAVAADIEPKRTSPAGQGSLPAVLVIAETQCAADVLALLEALRDVQVAIKPRVWPAFVGGDVAALSDFDQRLDGSGAGLCDVVLALMGAPSAAEQASALGAWLHVKMPAPASVLGELPDSQGRICRYVAMGSTTVESPTADGQDPSALPSVDVEAVTLVVQESLVHAATTAPVLLAAQAAAHELREACLATDPAAILGAEQRFAAALVSVANDLAGALNRHVVTQVAEQLGRPPVVTGLRNPADSEQLRLATPIEKLGDRSDQVSALVLMSSKGGMSKLFGKNKITTAAATLANQADADLDALVATVVEAVGAQVKARVQDAVEVQRDNHKTATTLAAAERTDKIRAAWDFSIEKARSRAVVWTPTETAGIKRAWGGPVPAPRRYLVGSMNVVRHADDRDDTMTVIDLRESAESGSELGRDPDNALVDLADRAVVLVAQYGLPLVALR